MARRQRPDEARADGDPVDGALSARDRGGLAHDRQPGPGGDPNQAFNQIPAEAQAWLDIRFPAEDGDLQGRSAAEIRDFLQTFCEPGSRR
jgi:acetylornithine deacetylase/succinyl-diaminopimelate desuccinylase-like protein